MMKQYIFMVVAALVAVSCAQPEKIDMTKINQNCVVDADCVVADLTSSCPYCFRDAINVDSKEYYSSLVERSRSSGACDVDFVRFLVAALRHFVLSKSA